VLVPMSRFVSVALILMVKVLSLLLEASRRSLRITACGFLALGHDECCCVPRFFDGR
jgi:hypothetical protein